MRGSALAAAALAVSCGSCGKPHGALIGFQGSLGATDIEVFVADTAVTGQTSARCLSDGRCAITPPPPTAGPGKFVDYAAEGWTSALGSATHAELDDHLVGWIELEPADGIAAAPALIAVQYNGTTVTRAAVIDDLALRRGDTVEVAMDLAATIDDGGDVPPVPGQLPLQVWRRAGDGSARARSACVLVQRPDGSHEFITPADDPDCDGATECSQDTDWFYCHPATDVESKDATCLLPAPTGACRFGGATCADVGGSCGSAGSAASASCALANDVACITPDVCTRGCSSWGTCNVDGGFESIHCTLRAQVTSSGNGSDSVITPCDQSPAIVGSAPDIAPFLGGDACQGLFVMPQQDGVAMDSQLTLGSGFVATMMPSGCAGVLQVSGQTPLTIAPTFDVQATVGFVVPEGVRLVPLLVSITDCEGGSVSICAGTPDNKPQPCP